MNKSMGVVLAVLVLAAIASNSAWAATAKPCGAVTSGPGCAMGGVRIAEQCEAKMAKAFEKCEKAIAKLYEKYEDEFVAIHEKHEGKIVELAEKIEALQREIDGIASADEPDLGKLESSLKKISDLREERTKLRFRMHKEARAIVDEADRAALDRHFAMGVGCCGGMGLEATYHPGRAEGRFEIGSCCPGGMPAHCRGKIDMKACCPGGMPSHCTGKIDMKACCPGGMPSHCTGKIDPKACCPRLMGHTSAASPRMLFVGEKDGQADIQVLADVDRRIGCAPGTLGEKHIECDRPLIIKRVQETPDSEVERLEGDGHRIIERVHAVPAGAVDEFTRIPQRGSVGPF